MKMSESEVINEDVALKEMTDPTAREKEELAKAKTLEKQEQLCQLSRALAVLASASVSVQCLVLFPVHSFLNSSDADA